MSSFLIIFLLNAIILDQRGKQGILWARVQNKTTTACHLNCFAAFLLHKRFVWALTNKVPHGLIVGVKTCPTTIQDYKMKA